MDLQDDFSLNQPLSPFVVEYLEVFDPDAPDYALDVLTLVESVLEDPRVVLMAQLDRLKDHMVAAMKAEGVEYEERMERLAEATWPQPNAEELWAAYRVFAQQHPWVGEDRVRPKSIARDMYETGRTFRDYVTAYGLKRSEGVLLRYLSDVYKTMQQTVPESARTDEVDELIGWLGAVVRQVDSSLIDEWERLTAGDPDALDRPRDDEPTDITTDLRGIPGPGAQRAVPMGAAPGPGRGTTSWLSWNPRLSRGQPTTWRTRWSRTGTSTTGSASTPKPAAPATSRSRSRAPIAGRPPSGSWTRRTATSGGSRPRSTWSAPVRRATPWSCSERSPASSNSSMS